MALATTTVRHGTGNNRTSKASEVAGVVEAAGLAVIEEASVLPEMDGMGSEKMDMAARPTLDHPTLLCLEVVIVRALCPQSRMALHRAFLDRRTRHQLHLSL